MALGGLTLRGIPLQGVDPPQPCRSCHLPQRCMFPRLRRNAKNGYGCASGYNCT
ncbi:hypothetical protein FKM82_002386 [Ascaphus truei]